MNLYILYNLISSICNLHNYISIIKMIYIKYEGRQGNFIFQYLFGRYISFLTDQKISNEKKYYNHTGQKFILFKDNLAKDENEYEQEIFINDNNYNEIIDKIDTYKDYNIRLGGRKGYFQNSDIYHRHPEFIKNIISHSLGPPESEMYSDDSVVIHIRLDDFHRNGFDSEILSFSYYDNIILKCKFKKVFIVCDIVHLNRSSYKKRLLRDRDINYEDYEKKYLDYFVDKYNAKIINLGIKQDFDFFQKFNNIILSASSFGFWGVGNKYTKSIVHIPINSRCNATHKTYKILEMLGHKVYTYNDVKFINFNDKIVEIGNILPSCEGIYTEEIIHKKGTLYPLHFDNDRSGFFANCSLALYTIVRYHKITRKMPHFINYSQLFHLYKQNCPVDISNNNNSICKVLYMDQCPCKTCDPELKDNVGKWRERFRKQCSLKYRYDFDISGYYFKEYKHVKGSLNVSNFKHWNQFHPYTKELIDNLKPFINHCFSPSENISMRVKFLEQKYNLDYSKTCVLFFRGGDKSVETKIPKYEEYTNIIGEHFKETSNIRFLIQSDEKEFLESMEQTFQNHLIFRDEIRSLPKKFKGQPDRSNKWNNFEFSQMFLAIIIIMSKCKYVYCNSGNCSLWLRLYRPEKEGYYQWIHWQGKDQWI